MDQPQIIVADLLAAGIRTAGDDLNRIPSAPHIGRDLKKPVLQEQILPCRIIPIQHEPDCQ